MGDSPLDDLVERLERTCAQLRAGGLEPDSAAALVDECARVAGEAAAQLDRGVRAGESGLGAPPPGQLALDP